MKQVLFLIIFTVGCVIHAHAQDVDSSQVQSTPITIESLSLKLEKLQHDYDFMYCDYELDNLIMDLKGLSQTIDISSNSILINVYNSRYDHELYKAYLGIYTAYCSNYEALKKKLKLLSQLFSLR